VLFQMKSVFEEHVLADAKRREKRTQARVFVAELNNRGGTSMYLWKAKFYVLYDVPIYGRRSILVLYVLYDVPIYMYGRRRILL
jgi:hypothetical protein